MARVGRLFRTQQGPEELEPNLLEKRGGRGIRQKLGEKNMPYKNRGNLKDEGLLRVQAPANSRVKTLQKWSGSNDSWGWVDLEILLAGGCL